MTHRSREIARCEVCGRAFYPYHASARRFCSYECHNQSRRAHFPSRAELENLYLVQRKTAGTIAKIYGVTKATALKWLRRFEIPLRHSRGHHEPKPNESELAKLLESSTLKEVAQHFNCDPGTVKSWAKGYGLRWDSSQWGQRLKQRNFKEPPKELLQELYLKQRMSIQAIADEIPGANWQIIKARLKRYGIPLRPPSWNQTYYKCRDGHLVKSTYEQRIDDWLSLHNLEHQYEPSLPFSPFMKADFLVRDTYLEIWGVTNSDLYQSRKALKRKQYHHHKLKLLEINYWDFSKAGKARWERKLFDCFLS